jgi:hypothetical protein
LYRGDKLINLLTLAKIQDAYNITFEIKAKLNTEIIKAENVQKVNETKIIEKQPLKKSKKFSVILP